MFWYLLVVYIIIHVYEHFLVASDIRPSWATCRQRQTLFAVWSCQHEVKWLPQWHKCSDQWQKWSELIYANTIYQSLTMTVYNYSWIVYLLTTCQSLFGCGPIPCSSLHLQDQCSLCLDVHLSVFGEYTVTHSQYQPLLTIMVSIITNHHQPSNIRHCWPQSTIYQKLATSIIKHYWPLSTIIHHYQPSTQGGPPANLSWISSTPRNS